ncbi:LLM class flavin-dependent oxidoreductase [Spirilliplanes yamanashiensis]|uniref:Alkanesulfonate monooxygenase n=1 Tax=Spirilliplanes yamanashiensis TaxID=42233 RepID=A0A8J4DI37_9ACTN|nr:LLM class flavin-dependent oxidoreductase [Spirilliplanes yamanashiensis]MDP9819168.1 alkanesulfonate monooxygenase [Spirilliplanes yamanashiensis]GIJ02009.1 alkanesulfonate monooxygenase [Spirilliplanes yamanashiensis]
MPVDFIGLISTQDASESRPATGPLVDRAYTARIARAHEDAGFDQVLIGYSSAYPDPAHVAAYAAARTERLTYLVAHRPGVVAPTVAARTFATLDRFSGGRVTLNIITGGHDAEQRRDGDYLSKDDRYARSGEYLSILRRAWESDTPFSHSGRFYAFEDFVSQVRPAAGRIPVYFSGSSPAAYATGVRHADVHMFWGEPLAAIAEQIAAVRAAADAAGVPAPRFSVSFRPILGATEELAWRRAHDILARIDTSHTGRFLRNRDRDNPANAGSQRLLAFAADADRHDRALWTATAKASGAAGNSTALVGTPDTVAQALLDYHDLGVTTFLIRGYDPLDDAVDYGRELVPAVRAAVADRDRTAVPA